ncbi:methylated-DNA--[protein]-cysteine S-methyltransferase [Xanthomonas vesicatoria]|uniref:methylated-DNA--[protein]-cysteine S-methyltransferase n=1 Tax=Xanthomonas vesicatoria TaxID=56460 RepID=UPI0007320B05|nr:methylated-DNA--[protein]-cysteine S-methyltransferase [Xanthomonas vesicatoria]KTF30394.1 cysteine methyltransferase [Xanthomonas vesicatoria]MCC8556467.1 methylated-DNA--[protein]-cysteine S-methyltransferase [Xanthomonas vesicatoria]MCC8599874.1 methylated-DNA--[protein]-cysteine S-methyltransferase [Xanthomonas vesicatoria]MCC8608469.1 methylated-DNA--[protein]-cysteine S-methyltransferase [Xanthomonas vesicatoria]MCC8672336.1 methylated-DNA--[protein]-cysteine S-methyltransferase [Xant
MNMLYYDTFPSPIGALSVAADDTGVHHILFAKNRYDAIGRARWLHAPDAPLVREAREQLLDYLHGGRRSFDLPLAPIGTPFQLQVWHTLAQIPFGQTWSYAQLAQAVGRPAASRAVGAANGRNPLPIVLPCHRVIGANGALTGFGGGLPTKQALLQLEGWSPRRIARADDLLADQRAAHLR